MMKKSLFSVVFLLTFCFLLAGCLGEKFGSDADSVYHVFVPDRSVEDSVSAGDYSWSHDRINTENFGKWRRSEYLGEKEIILLWFDAEVNSWQAMKEMDLRGLRPATILELLAFGEQHGDCQKNYPIVGLGSVWNSGIGERGYFVPVLFCGADNDRSLNLYGVGDPWSSGYRFAGVRK